MFFQRQFQNSERTMGLTDRLSVEMYENIWYKHFITSLYSRFLCSTARNYRDLRHDIVMPSMEVFNGNLAALVEGVGKIPRSGQFDLSHFSSSKHSPSFVTGNFVLRPRTSGSEIGRWDKPRYTNC